MLRTGPRALVALMSSAISLALAVPMYVNTAQGSSFYSGNGDGWTVPQHSSLKSYACYYDLCNTQYPIDGTPANPMGLGLGGTGSTSSNPSALDFNGPNQYPPPYTYTVDMGLTYTYSSWRVAGSTWYSFGTAALQYVRLLVPPPRPALRDPLLPSQDKE